MTFNPINDVENGKMLLVRSRNKDEGEMIWMAKATSDTFQDDESDTLHVKVDWWKPSLGNTMEKY